MALSKTLMLHSPLLYHAEWFHCPEEHPHTVPSQAPPTPNAWQLLLCPLLRRLAFSRMSYLDLTSPAAFADWLPSLSAAYFRVARTFLWLDSSFFIGDCYSTVQVHRSVRSSAEGRRAPFQRAVTECGCCKHSRAGLLWTSVCTSVE